MTNRREHWEQIYATRPLDQLSWAQPVAAPSLRLIEASGVRADAPVVDVGGGASPLAADLVARGYSDLTVVDIAEPALAAARARLGAGADRVTWVVADVLAWRPTKRFALWHDRAVFHFLTRAEERARYRAALEAGLAPGGWLVIAAFAPDGPERCSGLPVHRWSPEALGQELGPGYRLAESFAEEHHTPGDAVQRFTWALFQKSADPAGEARRPGRLLA
jgi:SAM-dependent methyltransferase